MPEGESIPHIPIVRRKNWNVKKRLMNGNANGNANTHAENKL